MTTDELNAIVQAVMTELEKAGVDFDFKAETPQADDLVYVMRGTADKYQGITVKWQNLLDIIVQKATEARDDAISAKGIALETLATIQSIESNISTMKTSVEASKSQVEAMKDSVETSEANVTQMKSDVSEMKASVEGTKTEVEGLKSDVTALKAQTQTIVDNAKEEVTGLLDTKVDYTDALTYEEIMATNPVPDLTNKVASASALKELNGSMDDGYIRLGNGLQICWGNDLTDETITFPVPFKYNPSVSLARYNNDTGAIYYLYTTINNSPTSFMIKATTLGGTGVTARVSWIAVGRWK